MKTFIIEADISNDYSEWEDAYVSHRVDRLKAGVKDVLHGKVEDEDSVVMILQAEDFETLEDFLDNNIENLEDSGHILDTTSIITLDH